MNTFKTAMLMSLMTALFLAVGALVGGSAGVVMAFLFAAGANLFAYWNSDKMLLSMYGARQVDAVSAPDLYRLVERLSSKAELPMPKLFVAENPQPNAFATGAFRDSALVAVSTGLLQSMTREEVGEKARDLCAPILGKKRAVQLIDAIWNLDKLADVRKLRPLLQA